MSLNKEQMIQEILLTCKANDVHTDGDVFFALAFRTESELKKICQQLHIRVDR